MWPPLDFYYLVFQHLCVMLAALARCVTPTMCTQLAVFLLLFNLAFPVLFILSLFYFSFINYFVL